MHESNFHGARRVISQDLSPWVCEPLAVVLAAKFCHLWWIGGSHALSTTSTNSKTTNISACKIPQLRKKMHSSNTTWSVQKHQNHNPKHRQIRYIHSCHTWWYNLENLDTHVRTHARTLCFFPSLLNPSPAREQPVPPRSLSLLFFCQAFTQNWTTMQREGAEPESVQRLL